MKADVVKSVEEMKLCVDCEHSCGESTRCKLIWRRPDNGQNLQLGLPKARSYEWACGAQARSFKKRSLIKDFRITKGMTVYASSFTPVEHTCKVGETVSERCQRTREQNCGRCDDTGCGDNMSGTKMLSYVDLDSLTAEFSVDEVRTFFNSRFGVDRLDVQKSDYVSFFGDLSGDLTQFRVPVLLADEFRTQARKVKNKKIIDEVINKSINPALYDVKEKLVKTIGIFYPAMGWDGHSGICRDSFDLTEMLVEELKQKLKTLRELRGG